MRVGLKQPDRTAGAISTAANRCISARRRSGIGIAVHPAPLTDVAATTAVGSDALFAARSTRRGLEGVGVEVASDVPSDGVGPVRCLRRSLLHDECRWELCRWAGACPHLVDWLVGSVRGDAVPTPAGIASTRVSTQPPGRNAHP